MSHQSSNHESSNGKKLEQLVDSNGAKFAARVFMPILLALMAYLGMEIRADIRNLEKRIGKIETSMAVIEYRLGTQKGEIQHEADTQRVLYDLLPRSFR